MIAALPIITAVSRSFRPTIDLYAGWATDFVHSSARRGLLSLRRQPQMGDPLPVQGKGEQVGPRLPKLRRLLRRYRWPDPAATRFYLPVRIAFEPGSVHRLPTVLHALSE